jgi:hypothetical protein
MSRDILLTYIKPRFEQYIIKLWLLEWWSLQLSLLHICAPASRQLIQTTCHHVARVRFDLVSHHLNLLHSQQAIPLPSSQLLEATSGPNLIFPQTLSTLQQQKNLTLTF